MLISMFAVLNTFLPLKSLFDLGINPIYLWIIMFLVSFIIIPAYIKLIRHYELLGGGLSYQDKHTLFTITNSYSLLPPTFAILSFVFTQNLLISIILLVYGLIFGVITYFINLNIK